ncbi:MAG TPA: tocopherol cyclase family protein [Spirochaetota bacterium]|nr:tocopherol cyclase family protein [Spirochaetota bacterium]
MSIYSTIAKTYNPAVFQGTLERDGYFEGWYFKQVSADLRRVLAFIPGISLSGDRHAFIQMINGMTGESRYFSYDLSEFRWSNDRFEIGIGACRFSAEGMSLDIASRGTRVKGALEFVDTRPYPVKILSPGIMGWYSFVPSMECYHGVVSMGHRLSGSITIDSDTIGFEGGRGYIEKDWGVSFPESWIWLQGNTFPGREASFMLSIAKIPWRRRHFNGFLCFLYEGGSLYRFMTYTGARIDEIRMDDGRLFVTLSDRRYRLSVKARQLATGALAAPAMGTMNRPIKECGNASLEVRLEDSAGRVFFEGNDATAGMEAVGDVINLMRRK